MCARFHAHCAARLADLEHTQFDQKLNTDNLTKCLQTLKHMYADVGPDQKPREAEFRGYIALLNLGDANFWWEVSFLFIWLQCNLHALKVYNFALKEQWWPNKQLQNILAKRSDQIILISNM